jgi:general stress protein 26
MSAIQVNGQTGAMMNEQNGMREDISKLLISQRLGVLSTQFKGAPYSSLVAFAASKNLSRIYFFTPRTTRKYRNLSQNKRVSMLIDNRDNRESDFHEAAAVTAIGKAREIEGEEKESVLPFFLIKHPYLTDFARSASCAAVEIEVMKYVMVKRFQHVTELHMVK